MTEYENTGKKHGAENTMGTMICVHRASSQIGGNCIEIRSASGQRLILDFGRPLDTPDAEQTPIPETLDLTAPVQGVLISHAHVDHYGMLETIPQDWPLFSSEATAIQIRLAYKVANKPGVPTFRHFESQVPFVLGDFTITPYLVDHSAFSAFAFKVEVDGKLLFYSGDFRTHGYKGKLMPAIARKLQGKVDLLLQEGTNFRAAGYQSGTSLTEAALVDKCVEAFNLCKGRVFASFSTSNVDRIVTLYKACLRTGRFLVLDLYTMLVLYKLGQFAKRLPNLAWNDCRLKVVVTTRIKHLINRLGDEGFCGGADAFIDLCKKHGAAIAARKLNETPDKWVIHIRDSLIDGFEHGEIMPNTDDMWLWSMWKGYLKTDSLTRLKQYLAPCDFKVLHSSGHGLPEDMIAFARMMNPKKIAIIHTESQENFSDTFPQTVDFKDGCWVNI